MVIGHWSSGGRSGSPSGDDPATRLLHWVSYEIPRVAQGGFYDFHSLWANFFTFSNPLSKSKMQKARCMYSTTEFHLANFFCRSLGDLRETIIPWWRTVELSCPHGSGINRFPPGTPSLGRGPRQWLYSMITEPFFRSFPNYSCPIDNRIWVIHFLLRTPCGIGGYFIEIPKFNVP